MPTILITSMGGSGSNNLVETLLGQENAADIRIIGTHVDPFELAKAKIPDVFLVPKAADADAYMRAHLKLIERFDIDLIIANSDKEVAVMAPRQDELTCAHLLPEPHVVDATQDKFRFFEMLKAGGCAIVENIPISGWDDIEPAAKAVAGGGRFWIRPRVGAGSFGATWVETAEQARKWIELHAEMRGLKVEEYVFAPFLPGRDFNVSAMWQNGEFAIGKCVERLKYFFGEISLSGMGSTPGVTRTIGEHGPVDAARAAVEAVYSACNETPHGYFNADLKCAADGTPMVTEINIGRFPMINPHHDRVGNYNLLDLYIKMALDKDFRLPRGVYDLAPGTYILRGVDATTTFCAEERLKSFPKVG